MAACWQAELLSRYHNPPTLEIFHKSLGDENWNCPGLATISSTITSTGCTSGYGQLRDAMMAFRNKKADGETRTHNPNWVGDINGCGHTGCGMIFGYYNRIIRFVELDTF